MNSIDAENLGITYKYEQRADTSLAMSRPSLRKLYAAGWDIDNINRKAGGKTHCDFAVFHRSVSDPLTVVPVPTETHSSEHTRLISAGESGGVKLSEASRYNGPSPTEALMAQLETISQLKTGKPSFVIACDTEFFYPHEGDHTRSVLSWQLAFFLPDEPEAVHEVVFHSIGGRRLSIEQAIGYVLERFEVPKRFSFSTCCPNHGYEYKSTRRWLVPTYDTDGALWDDMRGKRRKKWRRCSTPEEAFASCGDPVFKKAYAELLSTPQPTRHRLNRDKGELAGYVNDYSDYHREGRDVDVTLLCHFGRADVSAFVKGRYGVDAMLMCSQVQGGLVTLAPIVTEAPLTEKYWRFYPVRLSVRDTMCHAPAKARSLAALGDTVGVPKLELPEGYDKGDMLRLVKEKPVDFMEYAAQDSLVTLICASAIYGTNQQLPVTASSAGVRVSREVIKQVYCLDSNDDFDRWYRGLKREKQGLEWDPRTRRMRPKTEMKPVSADAAIVIEFARNSYKGGLNSCDGPRWVDTRTYDLDLESAYPTAMCCVPDVDWDAESVIAREWRDHEMTPEDFDGPLDPVFAYVTEFEFPEGCKYPCLPVQIDGKLVYTRTLGSRDGTYVTGVEMWLALKLGARVHVSRAVRAAVRTDDEGRPTHSLYHVAKALVRDRTKVKGMLDDHRELVVLEQLLKQIVNSLYGKTAQGVLEKHSWDALLEKMIEIGESSITSPTHCSMTTAIVRCTLLAAMNELDELGNRSFSWTTDGFITDASEDEVNDLPLFGMAGHLRQARMNLVGNPRVWAAKHEQDEFYNITTRGNCSPALGGVCAHNGYSSPFVHDSIEDRTDFLRKVLSRTGRVTTLVMGFTNHKVLSGKENREEFHAYRQTRDISMDFDMKRKPILGHLQPVRPAIDGEAFEVCNVDTVPYDTPEEFELWYAKARSCKCLRTELDWEVLEAKILCSYDAHAPQRHIRDIAWSKLLTCVMGHRLHVWTIPELDRQDTTVADKLEWINRFNASSRMFKESDWKNCRRQNRIGQMLERTLVMDLLSAMDADLSNGDTDDRLMGSGGEGHD